MGHIEFALIDPLRISDEGVSGATVMTISALYPDSYRYLEEAESDNRPPMRQRVRVLDHNLSDLTHYKIKRRVRRRPDHNDGTILYDYCSRCGGSLLPNKCRRCGVTFKQSVLGGSSQPTIPPKVVKYATSHGHKFAQKPPRA